MLGKLNIDDRGGVMIRIHSHPICLQPHWALYPCLRDVGADIILLSMRNFSGAEVLFSSSFPSFSLYGRNGPREHFAARYASE